MIFVSYIHTVAPYVRDEAGMHVNKMEEDLILDEMK